MSSTTDNFALPLYDTGDPANLRDQYNGAMRIIDGELKKSVDSTTAVTNTANDAKTTAHTAKTTADDAVGRLNALGITDNDTAATSKTRWDDAAKTASHINYLLDDYKASGDDDYTNAWNAIMSAIEDGGTIVFPSNKVVSGTFVVSKKHVKICNGITNSPIVIDVAATNDGQSGVIVEKMTFNGDNGVELRRGVGDIITHCVFDVNNYAIYANIDATGPQQVRQTIITENSMYSKHTGIYVAQPRAHSYYLGADFIVSNNKINCLVENVHIEDTDGVNILGNVMFLSLGGATKKNNIYIKNTSYSIVSNNELFEAGLSGIHTVDVNRIKIDHNQIVWPGQYSQVPGINLTVETESSARYYTITNNTIEHGSGDGIYANCDYLNVCNNMMMYPGSPDHWKGSGSVSGTTYGLHLVGETDNLGHYNSRGNYTIGNNTNFISKLRGVSDDTVYTEHAEYHASSAATYYKYFPHFVTKNVTESTDFTENFYSQGAITNIIVQHNHVTVDAHTYMSNANLGWGPLITIVSCFNGGSLTVGSINVPENTSKTLLIYASQVREI